MALEGKSAFVTGGTGEIGETICTELLKSGITHLATIDISPSEPTVVNQWRKNFPNASIWYYQVDVSSQEELEKCYKDFMNKIENLDIVVNCAGLYNEQVPKKVIDVNLSGVILSTMIAIEYMRKDTGKGEGGVILNIGSITSLDIYSSSPIYCATKQGVLAFTRALSHKRDYLGITFLTLCPGCTDTKLYANVFEHSFSPATEMQDVLTTTSPVQK